MNLHQWAIQWGVGMEALRDLQQRMGQEGTQAVAGVASRYAVPGSEGAVSNIVRLEASRGGIHLWRNNVGVLPDATGRPVRYGLANDSAAVNKVLKSSDLIGVRPRLILPQDVGHILGQFVAREVKEPGWHFSGTERELAQQTFLNTVASVGGDACFVTGEGSLA